MPVPDRFPDGGVLTFMLSQWGVRTWPETQMNLAPILVKFSLESLCIALSFVQRMVIFNQDRLTQRRVLFTLQGVPRAIKCPLSCSHLYTHQKPCCSTCWCQRARWMSTRSVVGKAKS